jgi:hypothetical protein
LQVSVWGIFAYPPRRVVFAGERVHDEALIVAQWHAAIYSLELWLCSIFYPGSFNDPTVGSIDCLQWSEWQFQVNVRRGMIDALAERKNVWGLPLSLVSSFNRL